MNLPYWLIKYLPMWDWICPSCRKEVKQKSHKCIHCGENYGMPVRVPPKILSDAKALEQYVHQYIFPKVSAVRRDYLTRFFTVLFNDGQAGTPQETAGDFSAWTGHSGGAAVVLTDPHHGTHNFEFYASGDFCEKTVVAIGEYYMRLYVKTDTLPPLNGDYAYFMEAFNSGGGLSLAACRFINILGVQYFEFNWFTALHGKVGFQTSINPVAGVYYCVELWCKKNTLNGGQGWINGNLEGTLADTTLDADCDDVVAGTFDTNYATTVDEDCVVFADARIYCEVSAAPKGTIAIHAKLAGVI